MPSSNRCDTFSHTSGSWAIDSAVLNCPKSRSPDFSAELWHAKHRLAIRGFTVLSNCSDEPVVVGSRGSNQTESNNR